METLGPDRHSSILNFARKENFTMMVNGRIMASNPRQLAKRINNEIKAVEVEISSASYAEVIKGKSAEQVEIWKKSTQALKRRLNTNFWMENLTSYFIKVNTRMLPTNVRERAFGNIGTENCTLCNQQESTEHIFSCPQRQIFIKNKAMEALERCKKVFGKCKESMHQAKIIARCTWNLDSARGFIPEDLIELWNGNENLKKEDLAEGGYQFIRAGWEIWKERCKENSVEKQKVPPVEYKERPKMESKPDFREICRVAVKRIAKVEWKRIFEMSVN